jgi:hypothetical protein
MREHGESDIAQFGIIIRGPDPAADLVKPSRASFLVMALQEEASSKSPNRADVLARYRRLREIAMMQQCKAMAFLSGDAILHHARRLGRVYSNVTSDDLDGLTLPLDLAIYTAPGGRPRAIDRYARSARLVPGSDEALVLEAMRDASFAILSAERRHPSAGLIVTDLLRDRELWLVDDVIEKSAAKGSAFAARYFSPAGFAMTTGAATPVDVDLLASALEREPQLLRKPCAEAINDWRFAEAIYRAALAHASVERDS